MDMVAPVYTFDPKILPEGSAKLRWAGRGADGCAQRTGAHAGPKPTSAQYLFAVIIYRK